jgi:hypothetical protein
MAADLSIVRMTYVTNLQAVAKLVGQLNSKLDELNTLYLGAGLSGTFVDAELLANNATKHITAADVGTYTANLNTINAALTDPILQDMAKAVGNTPS